MKNLLFYQKKSNKSKISLSFLSSCRAEEPPPAPVFFLKRLQLQGAKKKNGSQPWFNPYK